jgi:hypothetical protein
MSRAMWPDLKAFSEIGGRWWMERGMGVEGSVGETRNVVRVEEEVERSNPARRKEVGVRRVKEG